MRTGWSIRWGASGALTFSQAVATSRNGVSPSGRQLGALLSASRASHLACASSAVRPYRSRGRWVGRPVEGSFGYVNRTRNRPSASGCGCGRPRGARRSWLVCLVILEPLCRSGPPGGDAGAADAPQPAGPAGRDLTGLREFAYPAFAELKLCRRLTDCQDGRFIDWWVGSGGHGSVQARSDNCQGPRIQFGITPPGPSGRQPIEFASPSRNAMVARVSTVRSPDWPTDRKPSRIRAWRRRSESSDARTRSNPRACQRVIPQTPTRQVRRRA